ncbi:hypothetical protein ACLOJK_005909 [Asimina triloba]
MTIALQALTTLTEVTVRPTECAEGGDQPIGAAGDNFRLTEEGIVNVDVHMLGDQACILASQNSRWLDERGQASSGSEMDVQSKADRHTEKHEEMAADFDELVRCVEAVKDADHAGNSQLEQKYKALEERDICVSGILHCDCKTPV